MAEPMLVEVVDGIAEYLHHDEQNGTFSLQRVSDVESVIEENKRRQNDGTNGWSPSREWKHVARIPMGVCLEWLTKYGIDVNNKDHMPAVLKKLDDPEYLWLRIGTGRLT